MFGIEKDFQNLMEQVYGPLNKNKMTYNNDWKPTENNMPDTFHPTPQTPEQVDEGLRNAFRQAKKDGVMDATPYLKQTDISKVLIEGEYATIMGVKYKRVEEPPSPVAEAYKDWWGQYPQLETDSEYDDMRWQGFQAGFQAAYEEQVREDDYYNAKSQPRMEAERSGEVCVVFYNKRTYYRIEYTDEFGYVVWWRREKQDDTSKLVVVTDKETERLLEGLWFNEVKGGKYD